MENINLSKISGIFFKKIISLIIIILVLISIFICFEIYVPINYQSNGTIIFTVQKGWSSEQIANNLQKLGIIRSVYFFKLYTTISLKRLSLQAGEYNLSSKMSIYEIANKIAQGDTIKDNVTILEGWDNNDIGKYLESKNICSQKYFLSLTKKDYSNKFSFLADKPKANDLEGYLFPDTYQISKGESCEDILNAMLENFDKKMTPSIKLEIKHQKKSIFEIVTMASLIEKEVRTLDDKKIVSGILWKRILIGMPLQLDSTINYITGGNHPSVSIKDTKIDSPYNTYKYYGLPKGPISNPGLDSIMASIYPKTTNYLFYLTDGKTIFSETLEQQNAAATKYLK